MAQSRGMYLACDERGAFLRVAKARAGDSKLVTTPGLLVLAIRRAWFVTVEAADASKQVLEQRGSRCASPPSPTSTVPNRVTTVHRWRRDSDDAIVATT